MLNYKKIIGAVENSRHATPVLTCARRLAVGSGAELLLIHVIEPPDPNLLDFTLRTGGFESRSPISKYYTDQVRFECTERIDRILYKAGFPITYRLIFGHGKPCSEIIHAVRAENVDLLIAGCDRSGILRSIRTGSTIEALFRNCPIPLLIVR